jgi:hypothetical protein
MNRELDLLGEFELTGKWWFPGNPSDQLYGCLRFKRDYIILEVSGVFSKEHRFQFIESKIMHGLTNDAKKVTLYLVSERYFERAGLKLGITPGPNDNFGKSDFSCKYIFIGRHFSSVDDIRFDYMNMNFTYLDNWINNTFECKYIADDKYNIKMERIDYELKLEHIDSTIRISSALQVSGDCRTDVKIYCASNIGVKPNTVECWEWFQELILNLENLLALFIGYPIYPVKLSAQIANYHNLEIVNIYYTIPNPLIFDDFHLREIPISFQDLVKYSNHQNHVVADVINNWLKKSDEIRPVVDLFFLSFYDLSMKPYIRFLTLMQAIEIFHRRVCGGKYIDSKEYTPVSQALLDVIPEKLNTDLKANLISKIASGNELSLKMRLKKLLNYGPGAFKWFKLILKFEKIDEEMFISTLVNTRNRYTHWNEDYKKPVFSEQDLPRINYELRLLLRIFLLNEIDPKGILGKVKIFRSSMERLKSEREIREFEKRQNGKGS